MSVKATYKLECTVVETIDTNVPAASGGKASITHDGFNSSDSLDGNSSVPATKVAAFTKALTAGAATIDLTALTGTYGVTVNGTGLKVQLAKFKAKKTNAAGVTIKFGNANPYNLKGSNWQMTLLPGQEDEFFGNEAAPDVAAGAKQIDLSGTGTDSVDVILVLG